MQIVTEKVSIDKLKKTSEKMFGRLVKDVIDSQYSSTAEIWQNYFMSFSHPAAQRGKQLSYISNSAT